MSGNDAIIIYHSQICVLIANENDNKGGEQFKTNNVILGFI